jgi:hypothetical protein
MVGPLLLVAYPNDKAITNSVRLATRKSSPPQVSGYKMIPIASGSYVNATHWVSTFVCEGCLTGDAKSFKAADAEGKFGWAVGSRAVATPGDANSTLTMHAGAQGTNIVLDLAAAKSEKYATWAALAKSA